MSLKVLIVDDQKEILDTVGSVLEMQGYSVSKAINGEKGINKCSKDVKAVFLDIMMPGLSGYDVAEHLRKLYKDEIKIVFISILSKSEVDLSKVDGFIQKPFNIDDVVSEAKRILS